MRNNFLFYILFCIFLPLFGEDDGFLWEIALPGKVLSIPVERKNGEVILICEDRRVYSLNSKNGRINWKVKPGGKLDDLAVSIDGSIIVRDDKNIFSIYGNGEIRWSINFSSGFDSNFTINDSGDIFFSSGKILYVVDRFGNKREIIDDFHSRTVGALKNSLLVYSEDNRLYATTLSGKAAWKIDIKGDPTFIKVFPHGIYLVYSDGLVEEYSLGGEEIGRWNTLNHNPTLVSVNFENNFIISGMLGITLISGDDVITSDLGESVGLYYSNGLLIQSDTDWSIHGIYVDNGMEFFPSGKIQLFKRVISLSNKRVWGDDTFSEYYKNIITNGNRAFQLDILDKVEQNIASIDLLDKIPNFYEILLVASSKQNKNQDTRQEAYRIIGLSRDLSFLPYLLSNLENEESYMVLPYIFYALGQLGVDRTGEVITLINRRIDDFYDEKLVINALYALYYINQYTNGEYTYKVFSGIEKILDGGYSRKIDNMCYDVIDKIK